MSAKLTNNELQTKLDQARMELADALVRIKELELPLPHKLFAVWVGDPTDSAGGVVEDEFLSGIYSQQKRAAAVRKMINESDEPYLAYVEEIEVDQAPAFPTQPSKEEVDWFGEGGHQDVPPDPEKPKA